jgi:D-alanine-D-alanine ligase
MNDHGLDFDATRFGRVAVLYGGWAAEREVSLRSGQAVLDGLLSKGVDAHGIDVDQGILSRLADGNFDRAFVVLHGRGGEDGVIQGALEVLGLPYTGSGVIGSALGMDKYRSKLIWRGLGLPTPPFQLIQGEADLDAAAALGFPLMIKPIHEGSSIGMSKVESRQQLAEAWNTARQYDGAALAERWIVGKEYTASILDGRALPLIRLETPRDFYDYQAKYSETTTRYHCPCGLGEEQEGPMRALALQAFEAIDARAWGRVDLMRDEQGNSWLIEVNTVPGMTDHSLVPMAAKVLGIDFAELVWRILATTLAADARERRAGSA